MKQHESKLQSACVRWFRYQYPQYVIFAVPNGGSRNTLEAKRLQQEGVLAGVSDLIVIAPNKTLFIEMKHGKGKQTNKQKEFQKQVQQLGYSYFLCNSFETFEQTIKENI
ncbi:VRR-NUC domain-containing protein [Capnocytophaga canimorsus]|uniref:VRR-NUC domain-containing protein n=1 Tax=Capnocytophaga canimorsus TaxID=28188 RepID=UPI00384E7D88